MSEKRLMDWDSFYKFITSIEMPTQYTSSETNQLRKKAGKYWDGLPKPTLPDVTGTRKLDSMTEEEYVEYRTSFMEKHRQNETKEDVIESITLHISWDEVPLLAVKWLLEKGFNVWEVGE